MKSVILSCAVIGAGVALGDPVFIGADGSGSGKLSEATHWDPEGIPSGNVKFDRNGTIGTDSDVTVGTISVNYANAALHYALGGHTFTASGGMNMGVSDTSNHDTLEITDGTFELLGHFYASMAGSYSKVVVGEGGRLSIPDHSLRLCGYSGSYSNSFYVTKNGSAAIKTLLVGDEGPWGYAEINGATNVNITTVQIGKAAKCSDCEMVIRDSKNLVFGEIDVGYNGSRSHLLLTNVTDFTCSNIYVGSAGATDASAEIYLPASSTPTLRLYGKNGRLLYDAGGATRSGVFFSTFPISGGDQRLELRNYNFTCTDVFRWRDGCTKLDLIIGKGSTFRSTFANYSPFYLESTPGTRFAVDGGTLDLTDAAASVTLQYAVDYRYGGGMLFEVINGGVFNSTGKDIYWGCADTGGVTKPAGNTIRVANGGTMTFSELRLWNSSQKLIVSNATVSAGTLNIPYVNAGWATNNVVRFEGTTPSIRLSGSFNVYQSVDETTQKQMSETIFEFAVPPNGFEQVPLEAAWFNLLGNVRLRVDASAYAGGRDWQTIIRGRESIIDISGWNTWANFISELPEGCEARLTADKKELQIRIKRKQGVIIILR